MKNKAFFIFYFFVVIFLVPQFSEGQISAPGASGSDKTNYTDFDGTDSIYVFCAQAEGSSIGVLQANKNWTGSKTFLWEKYDPGTGGFDIHISESTGTEFSEISGLSDGCYRVTITQGDSTYVERAWVFNDWFTSGATITESNCDWFKLNGEYTTGEFKYYDLTNNTELLVNKNLKVEWSTGSETVAAVLNPQIFGPPTKDTDYTFRIYDKFSCQSTSTVTYISIVTKAAFSIDKQSGEAPLIVTFTNNSENGTPGAYEWFFFYDLDWIKENSESFDSPEDSIDFIAVDQSPVWTYEYSGTYMVKLVSKKISQNSVCVDTVYLPDYIVADTSFIAVPNVFTPNGDGTNDEFVVKFWSMQSLEIDIFNRWGKRIHSWQSGDVRGFEGTWTETVWDGRGMGGRYASPGVYYYNVVGEGRDGEKRRAHGFFHLFRDKD